jgi:hypothetical protein
MKIFILPLLLSLLAGSEPFDIAPGRGLPPDAKVLETRRLPSQEHPGRGLVLWMKSPEAFPRIEPDDPYTCPEETRGNFYSGLTFVSLMDVKNLNVLDTLTVQTMVNQEVEALDIPYQIRAGLRYLVEHPGKDGEGKPTILDLRDVNGDGRAQEFVLYDAYACMGLGTTLIGYSEKQDRLIQYPIHLDSNTEGKSTMESLLWADYLFAKKPIAPGHWRYEIDYSGRGGCVDVYDVRYDAASERFDGTFRQRKCANP